MVIQVSHRYSMYNYIQNMEKRDRVQSVHHAFSHLRPRINIKTLLSSFNTFSLLFVGEFKFWSITFSLHQE